MEGVEGVEGGGGMNGQSHPGWRVTRFEGRVRHIRSMCKRYNGPKQSGGEFESEVRRGKFVHKMVLVVLIINQRSL